MNKADLFKEWINKILEKEFNRNIWTRLRCFLMGIKPKTENIGEAIDFYDAYTKKEIQEEIKLFEANPDEYIRELKEDYDKPHPAKGIISR